MARKPAKTRRQRRVRLIRGDSLKVLRTLKPNSVDSVVTDPPYGLSKEPDAAEVFSHWIRGDRYTHKASGFMGKSWDSFVPGPEYWRECLRVLKPGGYLLAFGGTRTWDLLSASIRLAGFELRDTCQWIHGQGFPKSLAVDKAIDKMRGKKPKVIGRDKSAIRVNAIKNNTNSTHNAGFKPEGSGLITAPVTADAKKWKGFGTSLKPAWEPILMFRKPLAESTVARNVLRWGVGALNIDQSRIAHTEPPRMLKAQTNKAVMTGGGKYGQAGRHKDVLELKPNGRFPANLLLSHSPECVQVGVKRVKSQAHYTHKRNGNVTYSGKLRDGKDFGSLKSETVAAWKCVEGCPVAELDRQSGVSRGGTFKKQSRKRKGFMLSGSEDNVQEANAPDSYGDSGGASRFFMNFAYVPKVSSRERNQGLEGMTARRVKGYEGGKIHSKDHPRTSPSQEHLAQNHHPTVKPSKLMAYLIRMVTPPGGTVLDCFAGSGSTGIAAKREGFRFIGIEMDREYLKIARRRIRAA